MTAPALTIALPKGRTLGPLARLFERAGMTGDGGDGPDPSLASALDEDSRALVRRVKLGGHRLHLLLLKPDDVPTYVEYGTADVGICGRDVLAERDIDAFHPLDLGLGRCRLVVAGLPGDRFETLTRMPRVATKYPRLAAQHYARAGLQVETVNVQSSVELAPLTGLADRIVDLVETGTTLVETWRMVSTLLVVNRASYKLRSEPVCALVDALRAVVTPPG